MSNFVFVLDTNKQPLNLIPPGEARRLLTQGKAAVYRRYPFTIILKFSIANRDVNSHQLKIDPGSKTTGLAIVQGDKVIWGAELTHRGQQIKNALESRSVIRRNRRNRKTRYRKPRFLNRTRTEGWLPPSLESRVLNIATWVKRLCRYAPITGISQELVKFDTQSIQNPEISGKEYQQGDQGFPIRHKTRCKSFFGFQTGDMVRATLPSGKFAGVHVGRLTVRESGVFEMKTLIGKVSPVRHKYCQILHRNDGYMYGFSTNFP
ncbi:HNH endonuclease [Calothrix brevissima NIES-22]|nr:HNH endonuclease [Calothrix brevissima NIES-22]